MVALLFDLLMIITTATTILQLGEPFILGGKIILLALKLALMELGIGLILEKLKRFK